MTRSIILSLLTIAIIPITFADAVATSNIEVSSTSQQRKSKLDFLCTSSKTSNSCLSSQADSVSSLTASSPVWLKDIATILLSGSMFSGCRSKANYQAFSSDISRKSASKAIASGCIFLGQNYPNNQLKTPDIEEVVLSNSSSDQLSSSDGSALAAAIPKSPRKFPKISRSSLIVDFPAADSTFKPKNTKLANPAPETKRIASPFGWRRRPYSYQLQFHQGIDYGAPLGSPVVAVGDGIVTKVVSGCYDFGNLFCGGQLGNWVEIDHGNGAIGVYGHLKNSSISIEEGMKVWKNQEIAQVGSSGWSTGAHLDFRMKIDGEYEDPAEYLTPPNL